MACCKRVAVWDDLIIKTPFSIFFTLWPAFFELRFSLLASILSLLCSRFVVYFELRLTRVEFC